MSSVCIINGDGQYRRMFTDRGWDVVKTVEEADLVQFTGGSDVTPAFYGEKNTHSGNSPERDYAEQKIFHKCIELGKSMAGICRGGQFLNVMNGGRMHQHVAGHGCWEGHKATVFSKPVPWGDVMANGPCLSDDDSEVVVTSTHHQMFIPHPAALLLMSASIVFDEDPEALWYERTRSLCFQPHPEFSEVECTDTYFHFINKYILGA